MFSSQHWTWSLQKRHRSPDSRTLPREKSSPGLALPVVCNLSYNKNQMSWHKRILTMNSFSGYWTHLRLCFRVSNLEPFIAFYSLLLWTWSREQMIFKAGFDRSICNSNILSEQPMFFTTGKSKTASNLPLATLLNFCWSLASLC